MIGELLDRALAPFAPKMALQRMHARSVIVAYQAAKPSRTHKATRERERRPFVAAVSAIYAGTMPQPGAGSRHSHRCV